MSIFDAFGSVREAPRFRRLFQVSYEDANALGISPRRWFSLVGGRISGFDFIRGGGGNRMEFL